MDRFKAESFVINNREMRYQPRPRHEE